MNTKVKKRGSIQTLTTFWTTALMIMVLAVAPCALASTAKNTEITNTVTVTWNDVTGLNSYNTDATSTVTVDLVPSQPNIVYAPCRGFHGKYHSRLNLYDYRYCQWR